VVGLASGIPCLFACEGAACEGEGDWDGHAGVKAGKEFDEKLIMHHIRSSRVAVAYRDTAG